MTNNLSRRRNPRKAIAAIALGVAIAAFGAPTANAQQAVFADPASETLARVTFEVLGVLLNQPQAPIIDVYDLPADRSDVRQLRRQARAQAARIDRGFDDGRLTRREARKLQRRDDEIRELSREFLSDGVITVGEAAVLQDERDQQRQRLGRALNNRKTRF